MKAFTAILGITAFIIAVVAEYFSIFGILKSFDITVAVMAGALGLGKLVTTSYLYRFWAKLGKIRYYYLVGVIILMVFTSSGIIGYLSAAYQESSVKLQQLNTKIELYQEKYTHLKENRVSALLEKKRMQKNMDDELVGLTMEKASRYYDSKIRGRVVDRYQPLISLKDSTISDINNNILEVQTKISDIKMDILNLGHEIGPIMYIAKMFNLTIDGVVKWFIALIIFVFDPLAIALVIAYNRSLEDDNLEKNTYIAHKKPKKIRKNLIEAERDLSVLSGKDKFEREYEEIVEEIVEATDDFEEIDDEIPTEIVEEKIGELGLDRKKMEQSGETSVQNEMANLDEHTRRILAQKTNRSRLL